MTGDPAPVTKRPRWLLIAPQIPRADQASGDRRLEAMIEYLARRCDVTLVAADPRPANADRYEAQLKAMGVRFAGYGSFRVLLALVQYRFDAVLFEFFFTASWYLRHLRVTQSQALIIVDSVDLQYLRQAAADEAKAYSPSAPSL